MKKYSRLGRKVADSLTNQQKQDCIMALDRFCSKQKAIALALADELKCLGVFKTIPPTIGEIDFLKRHLAESLVGIGAMCTTDKMYALGLPAIFNDQFTMLERQILLAE